MNFIKVVIDLITIAFIAFVLLEESDTLFLAIFISIGIGSCYKLGYDIKAFQDEMKKFEEN